MATNENSDDVPPAGGGDLPVPDLRMMEELCQSTLNGRGGPIAPIAIQATNFRLKNDMIQQQMAKMFLEKYFPPSMVTKLRNEITNFRQRPDESLFEAWECYKLSTDRCPYHNMLPVTQIDTFYNGLTLRHRDTINAAAGRTFMKRRPKVCYDLIENMTAYQNDWILSLKGTPLAKLRTYMLREPIIKQALIPQPQVMTTTEFTNYMKANDAILKNMQTNMSSLTNSKLKLKNMFGQFMKMNTASSSSLETLSSDTVTNPKEYLKGITTISENAYKGPMIPTTSSPPKVVERETEVTKDTVSPTNNGSTRDVQPPVVQIETQVPNSEPVVAPVVEPVEVPVRAPKPNPKPRSFLKTEYALIDVYEGELTLRVGNKAVTFNLDQTVRYSSNYDDMSVNKIDVIDVACEEYSQKVLGFSMSGNPTPSTKPIVSTSSLIITPFGDNDFLLEETDAFLDIDDEPISPKIDDS
uniref:Reverse transcriptase domain-containing protein n=1 Tax=Tanacetum cinerariifolium TaxID=118510 RepID=A0A6L2JF36_TANCI|nr:reverse transcriptase domain-containing protein [Tanacetum cinerariifolium]